MRRLITAPILLGAVVLLLYPSLAVRQAYVTTAAQSTAESDNSLAPAQLIVANVTIEVSFAQGKLEVPRTVVLEWIVSSARAVAHYYGQFPVSRLRVLLISEPNSAGVRFGTTFGGASPRIKVWLGESTSTKMLQRDWVMTHEMVHLAFPHVPKAHHWLEEGIATYVEPLARFGVGRLPVEEVWQGLVRGLPHGLPQAGDRGLDHTPTWGRTYWGGALFCLLADLEIRQRTDNRYGLQDALRAIVAAGGTMEVSWSVTRALTLGDQAVGAPVLTELYERLKATPVRIDLEDLWIRLGVEARHDGIVFHDDAPLTFVRQAIHTAARGNLVMNSYDTGGHYD